ncbi:MAG TPA: GtrA family protein [Mesorhizobium sp.]
MGAILHGAGGQRLVRFVVVGVGAAALFFGLSWLLVSFGVPPFIGSAIAYGSAFCVAYCAQRSWTFEGRHDHGQVLPRYLTLQLGCALFSGVLAHVAVTRFGMAPLAMSAFTTLAASAASYVLSTFWVFADRR